MTKVIVLEAVYNNSESMVDYFDRYAGLKEWFVCELEGKMVTEAKLRRALRQLPEWLQNLKWDFEKGEKYSMSEHYYGQLVSSSTDIPVKKIYGGESNLFFLLRVTYVRTFEMNNSKEEGLPQSLEEVRSFVVEKQRRRELKEIETREKMAEINAKITQESHAVIDERGFHVLTERDKKEAIVKLQQDLIKKQKEDKKKVIRRKYYNLLDYIA